MTGRGGILASNVLVEKKLGKNGSKIGSNVAVMASMPRKTK